MGSRCSGVRTSIETFIVADKKDFMSIFMKLEQDLWMEHVHLVDLNPYPADIFLF